MISYPRVNLAVMTHIYFCLLELRSTQRAYFTSLRYLTYDSDLNFPYELLILRTLSGEREKLPYHHFVS